MEETHRLEPISVGVKQVHDAHNLTAFRFQLSDVLSTQHVSKLSAHSLVYQLLSGISHGAAARVDWVVNLVLLPELNAVYSKKLEVALLGLAVQDFRDLLQLLKSSKLVCEV